MARWGKSLWAVGMGVVVATSAFGEEPAPVREEAVSASAPSVKKNAGADKGQFLARVQLYSELAEELARLAKDKSRDERFTTLATQWKKDHLDANGRLTTYVLTQRVDLPSPVLEGEVKNRVRVAMTNLDQLRRLEGAQFERSFSTMASALPAMAARELMTGRQQFSDDQELVAVIDPLLQTLEQHRKDAEKLSAAFGPAAARRPPAQR